MLKLLQLLFVGHCHKWKIINEGPCSDSCGGKWQRYYLQCEHCGNIKIKD
jgi:hypothetical protein